MTSANENVAMTRDRLRAIASEALGCPIVDVTPIRVQETGSVYRGFTAVGRSVIIKQQRSIGDSAVRERAFLELARDHELPGVVRLLGASDEDSIVVLEDLGDGNSLADALLGDDAAHATLMLSKWVSAVAQLQVSSATLGRQFSERVAAFDMTARYVDNFAGKLGPALSRIGLALNDAILDELNDAIADLAIHLDGDPAGLVPGDTCPDNSASRSDAVVLFDFEGAQYRHVAWEVAYLAAPWPTCWCSWALPDGVARDAIERWRGMLAPTFPVVATDAFVHDVARATTVWSAQRAAYQLDLAIDGLERPKFHEGVAPSTRATVIHRFAMLAEDPSGVAPALASLARRAHQHCIDAWGDEQLPLAPAWRSS